MEKVVADLRLEMENFSPLLWCNCICFVLLFYARDRKMFYQANCFEFELLTREENETFRVRSSLREKFVEVHQSSFLSFDYFKPF